MFKFDLRTLLLLGVLCVVGWTQWKIYSQEQTITQLNSKLEKSQQSVSNLTEAVNDLREQMRIDKAVVSGWFETTTKLQETQRGYQTEVKDVLNKFQFDLAYNAKVPPPEDTKLQTPGYRIGDNIIVSVVNGMWNAFTATTTLSGSTPGNTNPAPEESPSRTPTE